jgi:hypothetical protein
MPELGRLSWSLFGLLFVLSHEAGAENSLFPFPVLEDAPALQAIIRKGRSSLSKQFLTSDLAMAPVA